MPILDRIRLEDVYDYDSDPAVLLIRHSSTKTRTQSGSKHNFFRGLAKELQGPGSLVCRVRRLAAGAPSLAPNPPPPPPPVLQALVTARILFFLITVMNTLYENFGRK